MTEDKILLIAMSRGSIKAFDALFRKYAPKVARFSSALLMGAGFSKADVDDLVQEIFLKIWQKRESLSERVEDVNAYFFRMTKNAVMNILTRNRRTDLSLNDAFGLASDDDVLSMAIMEETAGEVNRIVGNMPQERRRVFLMSREEGMSNKEIARQLSISTKTVEYHLGRAVSDIKKNLS